MGILAGTIIDAEIEHVAMGPRVIASRGEPTPLAERDQELRQRIDQLAQRLESLDAATAAIKASTRADGAPSSESIRNREVSRGLALDAARRVVEAR